jgi:hypothetical protein
MSSTKRQRVSDDEEPAPVRVLSLAASATAAAIEPELDEIPKLMKELQKEDAESLEQALLRISEILATSAQELDSDEGKERRSKLIWHGGVPSTLLAMENFPGHENIQTIACDFFDDFQTYISSNKDE